MSPSSLIRTLRFDAVHHYRRSDWSDEENRRRFGAYMKPHKHEFTVDVQVGGHPDEETGFLVDLEALDVLLGRVVGCLRGKDLNTVIPEVREGSMLPSTEALARWLFEALADEIPPPSRLERVRVAEGDTLASEYRRGERST